MSESRIITTATIPLQKSSPKTALALAAGLLLGLFMGAGTGLARELAVDVFRTPSDVERATGIACLGTLPIVATSQRKRGWRFRRASRQDSKATARIAEHVLDSPFSRFAETLRNVQVLINAARLERDVKVIGVVSSVPREGKTTVAANLGALTASSGKRTLLIDGDFHRRSLTAALAPEARAGLIEALVDPTRLAGLVQTRARSKLDILPCVLAKRIPNTAELLGSQQMADLLSAARDAYDYIFIELAPIGPVVDAKAAGHLIDSFVFVVEWGRSKRDLVLEALAGAEVVRERLAGIVLNKADPVMLSRIEAYKGKVFRSYYAE